MRLNDPGTDPAFLRCYMSDHDQSTLDRVSPEDRVAPELDQFIDLRYLYKEEIAQALDIVCRDSSFYPERYLLETTVPHGGE